MGLQAVSATGFRAPGQKVHCSTDSEFGGATEKGTSFMHVATTISNVRLLSCVKLSSILPPKRNKLATTTMQEQLLRCFDVCLPLPSLQLPFKILSSNSNYHAYRHYCSYLSSPLLSLIVCVVAAALLFVCISCFPQETLSLKLP